MLIQLKPKKSKKKGKIAAALNNLAKKPKIKLHYVENPWKASRFIANETMSEEEKKTDQLYKHVRVILNKLIPQNIDTLTNQMKAVSIDTKANLQGVVDLIVNKAIKEPVYSNCYAILCKNLAGIRVS